MLMETRELSISEANEYLLGLFRALLEMGEFRKYVDENYIIRQYIDDEGHVLRVEINPRDENNAFSRKDSSNLH